MIVKKDQLKLQTIFEILRIFQKKLNEILENKASHVGTLFARMAAHSSLDKVTPVYPVSPSQQDCPAAVSCIFPVLVCGET